mgnify:CR=1 FL=1
MQLYYSPFACSLAAHMVCREAGLDFTLHRSELSTKRVEDGRDLRTVNPMGQVPTLVTDDGRVLTENSAVLAYLADLRPAHRLAPERDGFERYELMRWLSLVGTEVHKKCLALVYDPASPDAVKEFARGAVARPLAVLDAHLGSREVLVGDTFTVADAYLLWTLILLPRAGVPLDAYPALGAYQKRLMVRPAVRETLAFERAAHERPFEAAAK